MAWTPTGSSDDGRPTERAGALTVRGRPPRSAPTGASAPASGSGVRDGGGRLAPVRRRQETPYLVLGLALVVVGALGAVLLMSRAGDRVDALALTRDVAMGQPVTAGDLRVEPVLAGSTVLVVRARDAASVVGRVAAVPLRAGRLLAPDDVGGAAWPPADQVLLAVAVAPG